MNVIVLALWVFVGILFGFIFYKDRENIPTVQFFAVLFSCFLGQYLSAAIFYEPINLLNIFVYTAAFAVGIYLGWEFSRL